MSNNNYCFFCGEKTDQVKGLFFICENCSERCDYGRAKKKTKGKSYKSFFD